MPITKSAQKSLRKDARRRLRNVAYKGKVKSALKQVASLISQKKTREAKELLPQVYKLLDKAAKAGVIKKNAASRKKSRISKLIKRSAA